MNDKIKELKEQATVLVDDDWGCIYPEFDEEKFAQLIVEHCSTVAWNHFMDACLESKLVPADYRKWLSSKSIRTYFGFE
jgi:hypothetical protein